MRAKSLTKIGCVTAIVSIVMLLIMLVYELYTYAGEGKLTNLLAFYIWTILFPIAYLLAVIKKRLKILRHIFMAWGIIWLISLLLMPFVEISTLAFICYLMPFIGCMLSLKVHMAEKSQKMNK